MTTTWGEIRPGDLVRDPASGVIYQVGEVLAPQQATDSPTVLRAVVTDPAGVSAAVLVPASQEVELWQRPPSPLNPMPGMSYPTPEPPPGRPGQIRVADPAEPLGWRWADPPEPGEPDPPRAPIAVPQSALDEAERRRSLVVPGSSSPLRADRQAAAVAAVLAIQAPTVTSDPVTDTSTPVTETNPELAAYVGERVAEAVAAPIDAAVFEGEQAAINPDRMVPEHVTRDMLAEAERQGDAEAVAVLEESLGPVEVLADEPAEAMAGTKEEPARLPEILDPLLLRSHLYLLHSVHVADVPPGPEAAGMLRALHATATETGPMPFLHIHQEGK